jgi:hypothetical protein
MMMSMGMRRRLNMGRKRMKRMRRMKITPSKR